MNRGMNVVLEFFLVFSHSDEPPLQNLQHMATSIDIHIIFTALGLANQLAVFYVT